MMIRATVLLWVVICMDQSQRITPMNSSHTDASDCLVNQNLLTPAQMRRAGRSNLFLYAEDSAHSTSAMKYVKMSSNVEFLTQPSAASIPNGSIKLMVERCRIPVNQDSDSGSEVYRLVFSSRIGSTRHPGNFLVLWSLPPKTSESEVASHTKEDTTAASNYVVSLHKLLTVGLNEHHIEIPAGALLAPFRLNLMVEVNQLSEESYEQMTLYLERVQSPVVTRGVEDDWSDLLPSTSPPFLDQRLIDAGTLVSVSNQQNLLLEPTTILPLPGALSSDPQAQRHHEKEEEEEEEDERILGPWEVATDSEVSGFLTNRTTFWSPAKSTQTLRVRAIHVALTTTLRRSVVCLCVLVLPSSTSGTSLVRRCSWVVEVDQKPPGTEGVPQSRRVTRVLSFEFGDVASRMLSAFLKLSVSKEGNRWKKSPVRRLDREVPLNESALVHFFQVHGRMEEGASPVDTTEPMYEDVDVIAAHPHLQRTDTTRVPTKGKTREKVPIAPPPLPPLPPPLLPPQTPPAPLPMDPEPEPEPHKQFEVEWSSPPLPRFSPYRDDSGGYKPRTLTPPYIPTPPAMDARMKLITGLVVGLVLPTVLIAIACCWFRTRARRKRTAAERRAAAANWWNSPEEGEQHIRLNNPAFENPSPVTSTENPPAVENDPTSYLDFL